MGSAGRSDRGWRHSVAARRLGALVAVFAVAGALLAAANSLLSGGDGAGNRSGSSSATSAAGGPAAASSTVADPGAGGAVIDVTPPPVQFPVDLLILGDSDAGAYAPPLQALLDADGIVRTRYDYRTSSGLARPDYFDWPSHMRLLVEGTRPEVVMVTFGGNDGQALRSVNGAVVVPTNPGQGADDTAWRDEYGRRVGEVMDYLTADGRLLVWVGIPDDDDPVNTARMAVQDAVVREQAAGRERVTYVDVWALFAGEGGAWSPTITDPRDGVVKTVRRSDGFHLNATGADILASVLEDVVTEQLRRLGVEL